MRARNIFTYILLSAMLACTFSADAYAIGLPWKKKKAKAESATPAPAKKTPYEKFLKTKGLKSAGEGFRIYKDKDNIWLEIPDSLVGRQFTQGSIVTRSSDLTIGDWLDMSRSKTYQIGRTDSLILIQLAQEPLSVQPAATVMAFPVKYRNAAGDASVVKANALFDLSRKDNVNLEGKSYGESGLVRIGSSRYVKDKSFIKGVSAFGDGVAVDYEATFELSISVLGMTGSEKPLMTNEVRNVITLLPQAQVEHRETDSRIGTRNVAWTQFREGGAKKGSWASRWDVSGDRKIEIYLDTLFSAQARQALREGFEAWNAGFRRAGLGDKVVVKDMTAATDPFSALTSTVMATSSSSGSPSARMTTLPDGTVVSMKMTIPTGLIDQFRRVGMFRIADVDPRYARYDIPEDAVLEMLRATVMRLFGQVLGLSRNLAGSYAYTPEQLRDPAFTQAHGFTASVTDDVMFNYLARPGDMERGVKTIMDAIGEYDSYAIAWLYGDAKPDDAPEHLYVGDATPFSDYRAITLDLGNDVFEAGEALLSHASYAINHLVEWVGGADITDERKSLNVEYAWLEYTNAIRMLGRIIGSVKSNEIREDVDAPKVEPLDKKTQQKALRTMYKALSDMSVMDADKALIAMSGVNKGVSSYTNMYKTQLAYAYGRVAFVAQAAGLAGAEYTPAAYMDDILACTMQNVEKGRLDELEEISVGNYLQWLCSLSDVTKQHYKDASGSSSLAIGEESLHMDLNQVSAAWTKELELLGYQSLLKARDVLKKGVARATDSTVKGKLQYLVQYADQAIEGR